MQHVQECVKILNICNKYYDKDIVITMVQNTIDDKLKSGKTCGNDELSAKHFMYTGLGACLYFCQFYIIELSLIDMYPTTL